MIAFITKWLLKAGINFAVPVWLVPAISAGAALFLAWWLYSSGLEAGRNECAAAALKEQARQIAVNEETRRKSDAEAVSIINEKEKRDAEIQKLEAKADAAPGAGDECFDADSLRRLDRVR